jgi:serine phosphatase RsbU (regulator of sigma subunit)
VKRLMFAYDTEVFPQTYNEELSRQSYFLSFIASVILLFVWLPYIPLDQALYPDEPLIVYFRIGLTAVAAIVLVLRFIPYFKKNGVWLAFIIELYLLMTTGILTGITKGDSSYMGGYLFIIMVTLIAPLRLYQNYLIMAGSVVTFFIVALSRGASFTDLHAQYSLRDLGSTVLVAAVFYFLIDRYRYKAFLRSKELQEDRNKLALRGRIIEKELSMARTIQQRLIPSANPQEWISAIYKPMDLVGGDFYDFIFFRDMKKIGIFLSDVSGHGIPAAFITSMIKSFILQAGRFREDPSALLHYLNDLLATQTNNNFITAFYGIIDLKNHTYEYANAGHNMPYVLRGDCIYQLLPAKGGSPLAVFKSEEMRDFQRQYRNNIIQLEPGTKIVLFTDGFLDTVNISKPGKDFETEKLYELMIANSGKTSREFTVNLYNALLEFRDGDKFEDDVCLICVDI